MNFKVVYVEWIDAASADGWRDLDCKDLSVDHCKSVGFLIKESKESISIAAAVSDKQCNSVITIPTSWIRKKKYVKVR